MALMPYGDGRAHRERVLDAVALAAAGTYVLAAVLSLLVTVPGPVRAVVGLAPIVVCGSVLMLGGGRTPARSRALGAVVVCGGAILVAAILSQFWQLGLAVPVVVLSALACSRAPGLALFAVALITATYGSTEAFLGFPSQQAIDLLLLGLWLAVGWGWIIGSSRSEHRTAGLWPGVALVLAFVLLSATEILVADSLIAALQSFRGSIWYLSVLLLLALAPWPPHVRPFLTRAVVVVALLAGSYATYRWAAGPAPQEEAQARFFLNNFLNEELRTVGSFFTAKELAAWTAMVTPFLVGMALTAAGWLRVLAGVACLSCIVAMLAADVRAGPAAAAAGLLVVFALFQLGQAFRSRRGPAVLIAIGAMTVGGAAAFALTLGDKQDSGARYRAILDPSDDPSYQARIIKWRSAVEDIQDAPFGHGLGTSGRAQQRYGRFVNIGSVDIDNAYLKVAHEQGFAVLGLFALAMLTLLGGLARRALTLPDPARAGPALAAAGTLTAMLVLFHVGSYIEGLPALWGWLLVGLGVGLSSVRDEPHAEPSEDGEAPGAVPSDAPAQPRASLV